MVGFYYHNTISRLSSGLRGVGRQWARFRHTQIGYVVDRSSPSCGFFIHRARLREYAPRKSVRPPPTRQILKQNIAPMCMILRTAATATANRSMLTRSPTSPCDSRKHVIIVWYMVPSLTRGVIHHLSTVRLLGRRRVVVAYRLRAMP